MALWTVCAICEKDLPGLESSYCDEHRERGEARDKILASIWFNRGARAVATTIDSLDAKVIEKAFEDEWAVVRAMFKETA